MASSTIKFFRQLRLFLYSAKYIQGIPNFDTPTNVMFEPQADGLILLNKDKSIDGKEVFIKFNKSDIINISVEDQTTIEKRIGFKRLLLVGIFAIAWRKKQTNPLSFLIIEYKDDIGLTQEVYLQSDKKDGYQTFNNIKYNLYKYWKEIEENPNLLQEQQKYNEEKKAEMDKWEGYGKIISPIIVLIIVAFLLYLLTTL